MATAQPPEPDAAAAGADIKLIGGNEPGGRREAASDMPSTTDEQSQVQDSPVRPGNS